MKPRQPHPIPYQGSKRLLAPVIAGLAARRKIATFYEPFAGSAAITLAVAASRGAQAFHLNDLLAPLAGIWTLISTDPQRLAREYEALWNKQLKDPRGYFDQVRDDFNRDQDPAKLLYLLARCVKNAVRFNSAGQFNQSPDNRRLGMRPEKLRTQVAGAHQLLANKTTVSSSDYAEVLARAKPKDLVYMDPPYQGTSGARDRRYVAALDLPRFVSELEKLRRRRVPFMVSFDGRCGEKVYGEALPESLGLTRMEVEVGRSSQATLMGRVEITTESLYVSPELAPHAVERVSVGRRSSPAAA